MKKSYQEEDLRNVLELKDKFYSWNAGRIIHMSGNGKFLEETQELYDKMKKYSSVFDKQLEKIEEELKRRENI